MKQKFIITKRPDRSAATMQTHVYDPATKRTKTKYVGSFSLTLVPSTLESLERVGPGEAAGGIRLAGSSSLELDRDDITRIRAWLEMHGTYRAVEADQLRGRHNLACAALAQAAEALERAAHVLPDAVAAAQRQGHALTSRRSQRLEVHASPSLLDALQARANRVRLLAFDVFTSALQAAGLMESRGRKKGATASRPDQQ